MSSPAAGQGEPAGPGSDGAGRPGGWLAFALFLLVSLALQAASFGDTNRHADETFYFLVGQRMHEGLLPYVDVWDRKPFGLFLAYYLIAGISTSVLAYQLVACVLAALAALLVCLLAGHLSNRRGGLYAGLVYLLILGPFEGATGQAPDFYNPLIAGAALLVLLSRESLGRGETGWRVWLAMALCGLALTIKQTTLFESAFLGIWVLVALGRAGVALPRLAGIALACCAIGALPTLLVAGYYALAGHWYEFWHAMVISNLQKQRPGGEAFRALGIGLRGAVLLAFALWGLWSSRSGGDGRRFLACWIAAALVGFLSVPNFYSHYTLPVLVPLSVAAGLLFARHALHRVLLVVFVVYALLWHNPFHRDQTLASIRSMDQLARAIRAGDPGGGLLVFDAPHYLYALTGERFLSPLVFPHHLNHAIENDVSHLDTHAEVDRILRNRPGVIVLAREPRNWPVNRYSRERVLAYAARNCRTAREIVLHEDINRIAMIVFASCRAPSAR